MLDSGLTLKISSSSGLKMKTKKVYESLKNNLSTYSRIIIKFVGLFFRHIILERDIHGKKSTGKEI